MRELKEKKERARAEDVAERLERRFEQGADELRKVDQEVKEMKLAAERDIQLVEKQAILQRQYEEELIFAEVERREAARREEAERAKQRAHREKEE